MLRHRKPWALLESSWSALQNQGTLLGKEGKGRFKALALGRVVDWIVTLRRGAEKVQYKMTLIRDDLVDVRVTPSH